MAISDKLQELLDIKQDIKEAIENKGVDMTGGSQGETWVINESPIFTETFTYSVNFESNNIQYSTFACAQLSRPDVLIYDGDTAYAGSWSEEAYRTITFETAPTGDLLTWLEANAVKQTGGVDFGGYAGKIDLLPAVVELTQAQYDALSIYDDNTYYLIVEA